MAGNNQHESPNYNFKLNFFSPKRFFAFAHPRSGTERNCFWVEWHFSQDECVSAARMCEMERC